MGTTPAGDDVICGVLAGLDLLGFEWRAPTARRGRGPAAVVHHAQLAAPAGGRRRRPLHRGADRARRRAGVGVGACGARPRWPCSAGGALPPASIRPPGSLPRSGPELSSGRVPDDGHHDPRRLGLPPALPGLGGAAGAGLETAATRAHRAGRRGDGDPGEPAPARRVRHAPGRGRCRAGRPADHREGRGSGRRRGRAGLRLDRAVEHRRGVVAGVRATPADDRRGHRRADPGRRWSPCRCPERTRRSSPSRRCGAVCTSCASPTTSRSRTRCGSRRWPRGAGC